MSALVNHRMRSGICSICGTHWTAYRPDGRDKTCGSPACGARHKWRALKAATVVEERQCVWCGEQWAGPGYDSPHGLVCRSECLRQAIEDAGQEVTRG